MNSKATIIIHVVPRARRSEVAGRHGDAIRVRIAAPPADGLANEELIRFLAQRLGIQRNAVTIAQGLSSRRKTVLVEGVTTTQAVHQLIAES